MIVWCVCASISFSRNIRYYEGLSDSECGAYQVNDYHSYIKTSCDEYVFILYRLSRCDHDLSDE
jgi:hypothetical protein